MARNLDQIIADAEIARRFETGDPCHKAKSSTEGAAAWNATRPDRRT
ncbi:MAG: hypothetical protein ACRDY7_09785 [Acidimicrobiia bacterium]